MKSTVRKNLISQINRLLFAYRAKRVFCGGVMFVFCVFFGVWLFLPGLSVAFMTPSARSILGLPCVLSLWFNIILLSKADKIELKNLNKIMLEHRNLRDKIKWHRRLRLLLKKSLKAELDFVDYHDLQIMLSEYGIDAEEIGGIKRASYESQVTRSTDNAQYSLFDFSDNDKQID